MRLLHKWARKHGYIKPTDVRIRVTDSKLGTISDLSIAHIAMIAKLTDKPRFSFQTRIYRGTGKVIVEFGDCSYTLMEIVRGRFDITPRL